MLKSTRELRERQANGSDSHAGGQDEKAAHDPRKIGENFIAIPMSVMVDERLKMSDKLVFGVVYYFARMGGGWTCKYGKTWLAEFAGISRGTMISSTDVLEQWGYLRCEYSNDKKTELPRIVITWRPSKSGVAEGRGEDALKNGAPTRSKIEQQALKKDARRAQKLDTLKNSLQEPFKKPTYLPTTLSVHEPKSGPVRQAGDLNIGDRGEEEQSKPLAVVPPTRGPAVDSGPRTRPQAPERPNTQGLSPDVYKVILDAVGEETAELARSASNWRNVMTVHGAHPKEFAATLRCMKAERGITQPIGFLVKRTKEYAETGIDPAYQDPEVIREQAKRKEIRDRAMRKQSFDAAVTEDVLRFLEQGRNCRVIREHLRAWHEGRNRELGLSDADSKTRIEWLEALTTDAAMASLQYADVMSFDGVRKRTTALFRELDGAGAASPDEIERRIVERFEAEDRRLICRDKIGEQAAANRLAFIKKSLALLDRDRFVMPDRFLTKEQQREAALRAEAVAVLNRGAVEENVGKQILNLFLSERYDHASIREKILKATDGVSKLRELTNDQADDRRAWVEELLTVEAIDLAQRVLWRISFRDDHLPNVVAMKKGLAIRANWTIDKAREDVIAGIINSGRRLASPLTESEKAEVREKVTAAFAVEPPAGNATEPAKRDWINAARESATETSGAAEAV